MRKVDRELQDAIQNFRPFSKQNRVFHRQPDNPNIWNLCLHGNVIAVFNENRGTIPTGISLAGWNTPLTRQVLNVLTGVVVRNVNYEPYLNGIKINENDFFDPQNIYK